MIRDFKGLMKRIRFKYLLSKKEQIKHFVQSGLKLGKECDVQDPFFSFFGTEYGFIEIGDDVTVNATARFITHDGGTRVILGKASRLLPTVMEKFSSATMFLLEPTQ